MGKNQIKKKWKELGIIENGKKCDESNCLENNPIQWERKDKEMILFINVSDSDF